MSTEVTFDMNAQIQWIKAAEERTDYFHWFICLGERKIGLINICGFDPERHETSWGFYIGEEEFIGLGGLVPPFLYNFLFFDLKIGLVRAEVLEGNEQLLSLHKLHGYQNTYDSTVKKNGREIKTYNLVLARASWMEKKRFHRYRALFPMKSVSPVIFG